MIDLLNSWVEKIKTNDAAQVADMYHTDGLLLGTFSNSERKGQKLILNYFENLFSKVLTSGPSDEIHFFFKTDKTLLISSLFIDGLFTGMNFFNLKPYLIYFT